MLSQTCWAGHEPNQFLADSRELLCGLLLWHQVTSTAPDCALTLVWQAVTLGALGLVAAVDIYEHRDHSNNVSPLSAGVYNNTLL